MSELDVLRKDIDRLDKEIADLLLAMARATGKWTEN